MVSVPNEALLAQISQLLDSFDVWRARLAKYGYGDIEVETQQIRLRLYAAIRKIAPRNSVYWDDAEKVSDNEQSASTYQTLRFGAIVLALRDDIEAGWLSTVEELVHADTFSNFLDMSQELLEKGYKDPAAVLAGAVLESHLRGLCAKHDIATLVESQKAKKAEVLNADLKKAGVYPSSRQKQVITWQDIRNRAAHGEFDKFADQEVKLMIMGIGDFIAAYPA